MLDTQRSQFKIPTLFVDQMLQIHTKYLELIKELFHNDQEFSSALDKACSTAINFRLNSKTPCKSPELVSTNKIILIYLLHYKFD
jgi:cullin 2